MVLLIQGMASFFATVKDKFQARYKLDVNQVVKQYNAFLQHSLITTSLFQDILDGKLNARRRAFQLIIMLHIWLYMIPRYSIIILLYFQDETTRMHYQYILADYAEEMGMFGRTFNVLYVVFAFEMFINYVVLRKYEGRRSVEFLTDWLKWIPKKASIKNKDAKEMTAPGDLDNDSKHKLMSYLHYKLILAQILARAQSSAVTLFELITFPIFIYNRRPSFFIACVGVSNLISMLVVIEIAGHHFTTLYLCFVVTTDYFKVVINNIIRKVDNLKIKGMTNRTVTAILHDYDLMMIDFKKYNRVLKPLLRNLVHFYIFGLTSVFFAITLEADIWMLATTIFGAGGISSVMLATGIYVSRLQAKVIELHNTLASLCSRHIGDHRRRLSLKCMFRLKHVIQELGSLETDGQFVIGLRDGEGAATSRMEIFQLTMETVSNTMMIFGIVNGINSM